MSSIFESMTSMVAWRWAVGGGIIGLTILVAALVQRLFRKRVGGDASEIRAAVVGALGPCLRIAVWVGGVWAALSCAYPAGTDIYRQVAIVLLGLDGVLLAARAVDLLEVVARDRFGDGDALVEDHLLPVLSRTLKVFIVTAGSLLILGNLGVDVSALLAGLGIGGLAVALAAQDTVANVFASVAILVDRPFVVGNAIRFDGSVGSVKEIGLRSTRIQTPDGTVITLPNAKLAGTKIDNLSLRTARRVQLRLGLVYDTAPEAIERAEAILAEILGDRDDVREDPSICFDTFGESALEIGVTYWIEHTNYADYCRTLDEINRTVLGRFSAENLVFAFPTRTIEWVGGSGPSGPAEHGGSVS